ncbi:tetratricopeptide repeat protein [Kitasatospora sp. NBC_01250]|uniref:tetratricopeptide repeat protein n=1 Tax=Kitasatospora sp. NBC_01250 TaxID=2903571 RepID=UPI002E37EBB3|nr:tetratricopeptide repeat protein [Kitasatospora sp. NBC_01250]
MTDRSGGLDPQRVAEVIISTAAKGGSRRCGSGYLLARDLVLTAAHVLDGAASIRVRLNADQDGQWTARAQPAWSDADLDIAVLRILEASVDPPGPVPPVARVRFGRIVRPPVECETMGFPRFKVRDDAARPGADGRPTQYRDCEHATGHATNWANRREGTLEIQVREPAPDPDRGRSPWEGMSGAPVFCGDTLVGVIGKHHPKDGPGALAAYRVDHWYQRLDADRLAELAALIGLPGKPGGLTQVTAPDHRGTDGTPRQLPATTSAFTGRERELAQLLDITDDPGGSSGTVVIWAIDGMAGIGKTTLAVHAGHRLAERFPDGQLFVDLHGYTRGMTPRDPADALAAVLQGYGVPPGRIPADLDARAALYRGRLAGTRTLIILDNARSEAQVRPLLPGDSGCLVLVTSRRRLGALDDASSLPLDALPMRDAVALFREVAGPGRTQADDPLLEEIVELCGGLPLALRIAAALIRIRPTWTLSRLARRLRDARPSLQRFSDGERDLTSMFDLSYQNLTHDQKSLFRCLSLSPGAEIDAYAAAALLDCDLTDTEDLLQDLVDHNLLAEPAAGRYRMHDLIRAHAHTLAQGDPADQRGAAVQRLLNYYGHTSVSADTRTFEYARHEQHGSAPAHAPALPSPHEAYTWLRAERATLEACLALATRQGWLEHVVTLTEGLAELLYADGPWSRARALHAAAAAAAEHLGDRGGQADALNNLGRVLHMTGEYVAAADAHARAADLFQQVSERAGQADALNELGRVLRSTGDYPAAADAHSRALALYLESNDLIGQAGSLGHRGRLRRLTGDTAGAVEDLSQALSRYEQLGHRLSQAKTLTVLGQVRRATGDEAGAADADGRALTIYQELSEQSRPPSGHSEWLDRAGALIGLGRMRMTVEDYAGALDAHARALDIYREMNSYDNEAWATNLYAAVFAAAGDTAHALATYRDALRLTREVQHRDDEAIALEGIGAMLLRSTEGTGQGAEYLNQALAAYRSLSMRPDVERVQARLDALTTTDPS